MSKRILIIGYPYVDTNMGGVRLRRIARLLPDCGWEPVIVTHSRSPDDKVQIPEGIRIEEVVAPDLTRIYQQFRRAGAPDGAASKREPSAKPIGLTSKINRWLMIPDKQITWYRPAVQRGLALLRQEKFDAIFASLDPRTSLLIAARLSRETGVPCALEYRDLWTGNPYYHITQPTTLHRGLHGLLERRALQSATRVSAVSKGIAEQLSRNYAKVLKHPIALNYNFFSPEEYPKLEGRRRADPFTISYTGAMYGKRSPDHFFEGMRAFINALGLTPSQFRFRWAGSISGIEDLSGILDRTRVRPYLDFLGQVEHKEALAGLVNSHAALLIQAPHDAIHIPGKLFEAMGARVPLLALANPCEVTDIIERANAGIVTPHTATGVAASLRQFYDLAQTGQPWKFNEPQLQEHSASSAAKKLAGMFEELIR